MGSRPRRRGRRCGSASTSWGSTEVVSFTSVTNVRSRAVMDRLGMARDPGDDFDHPALPEGHPLRPHVLYRLCPDGPAGRAERQALTARRAW